MDSESPEDVVVSSPITTSQMSSATPSPSPVDEAMKIRVEQGEEQIQATKKKTQRFATKLKNLKATTAIVIGLVAFTMILAIIAIVMGSLAYAARGNESTTGPIDIGQNTITSGSITSSGKVSAESLASSGNVTSGDILSTGKITAVEVTATTINPIGGWNFQDLNISGTLTSTDVNSTNITATGDISGGGLLTLNSQPSLLFQYSGQGISLPPGVVLNWSNCFFGIPVAGVSQGTTETGATTDGTTFTIQNTGVYIFSMSTRWNNPQNPQLLSPELWMIFTTTDTWDYTDNRYAWINLIAGAVNGPPIFAQKKCVKGEKMQVVGYNPNGTGSAEVLVSSTQGMIITRLY